MKVIPMISAVCVGWGGSACQKTERTEPDPAALRSEAPVTTRPADAANVAVAPADPRAALPPLPVPLPGTRTDLTAVFDKTWRTAIADLDGDGDREIIAVDSKTIRVLDASGAVVTQAPVAGGILQLLATDLDGDQRSEIYAGWGQTRDHMGATAKVTQYRLDRGTLVEDSVLAPTTSRQEVVALVPMVDTKELLIAYFDSKYMVTSTVATKGAQGWTAKPIASLRTATTYARGDLDGDGKLELVVGRVYGDDKGIDGDVFVLAPDGTRKPVPSTRGLRSIAAIDSDGDKRAELFMGDGWHQNYGANARGLLTWVRAEDATFKSELIEDTPGQYEIMRTLPATIGGKLALVTLGSHYVRVFWRDGAKWRGLTIAGAARDIAVGDLDGKPGDEIVIIADKSELVSLAGAL